MTRLTLLPWLVAALGTALPASPQTATEGRDGATAGAGPVCLAARVLPHPNPSRRAPGRLVFSANQTGALRLQVTVGGPLTPGPHAIEFRVRTPRGDLYQSLRAPVPAARGPKARLPFVVLDVAGTAVTQSSLYGRWSFTTHLDGAAAQCGAPLSFVLNR
jgi:hypothetical protein